MTQAGHTPDPRQGGPGPLHPHRGTVGTSPRSTSTASTPNASGCGSASPVEAASQWAGSISPTSSTTAASGPGPRLRHHRRPGPGLHHARSPGGSHRQHQPPGVLRHGQPGRARRVRLRDPSPRPRHATPMTSNGCRCWRHPGGPLRAVVDHLERSRAERLANDIDPVALDGATAPTRAHGLAELSAIAGERNTTRKPATAASPLIVARRAELSEESAGRRGHSRRHRRNSRPPRRPAPPTASTAGPGTPPWGQSPSTGPAGPPAPATAGYGHGARWAIGPATQRTLLAPGRSSEPKPKPSLHGGRLASSRPRQSGSGRWSSTSRASGPPPGILRPARRSGSTPGPLYRSTERAASEGLRRCRRRHPRVPGQTTCFGSHQVDPAAYQLAEPLTAAGQDRTHLLDTAEIRTMSRHNPADLCAERRELLALVRGVAKPDTESSRPKCHPSKPSG